MSINSIFFLLSKLTISAPVNSFTFNGFININIPLDGFASITSTGLALTNITSHMQGHIFHPLPLRFKPTSPPPPPKALSFSTTFALSIIPELTNVNCDGLALVISRTSNFSSPLPCQYFGLFKEHHNGSPSNHIFVIEFDIIQNAEFLDINDNHDGINMNSLMFNKSHTAGYFDDGTGLFRVELVVARFRAEQNRALTADMLGEGEASSSWRGLLQPCWARAEVREREEASSSGARARSRERDLMGNLRGRDRGGGHDF